MRKIKTEDRPNSRDRGYTVTWWAARSEFLRKHALCLGCAAIGVRQRSELVDHIVPHQGNQELFWDVRNWQPSCAWHHNSIKPQLEREWKNKVINANDLRLDSARARALSEKKYRPPIGLDGYPIKENF